MHFQTRPFPQGKLIMVNSGEIFDVIVDLRKRSKTFSSWTSVVLNSSQKNSLWIPEGFAHGFVTIENNTIFNYKCTEVYNKESEGCLLWDDADLDINWGVPNPLVSKKDMAGMSFKHFKSQF